MKKKLKSFKILKPVEDKIEWLQEKVCEESAKHIEIEDRRLYVDATICKWYLLGYTDALKKDRSVIEKMIAERSE